MAIIYMMLNGFYVVSARLFHLKPYIRSLTVKQIKPALVWLLTMFHFVSRLLKHCFNRIETLFHVY